MCCPRIRACWPNWRPGSWDDADETAANKISAAILAGQPIDSLGDDAQLLARATIALLEQPKLYASATTLRNRALDRSFATDPIWAKPAADRIIAPRRFAFAARA